MNITFTDFYPLETLTSIIAEGYVNPNWDCHYSTIKVGNQSRTYPDNYGCRQKLLPTRLFNSDVLPAEIQAVNKGGQGLIYILTSLAYPLLYVGISSKNLQAGLFSGGRFSHHLRKIFAIHNGSTSHTLGWQQPAIQRYKDRININSNNESGLSRAYMSCIGSDLQIAFAHNGLEEWSPREYEGTVFDYFYDRFKMHPDLIGMNTGKMKRSEVHINAPKNIEEIIKSFGSLNPFQIDHSLDLNSATNRYIELKKQNGEGPKWFLDTLARVIKYLWEDSWRNSLECMVEEWINIDDYAELILTVALRSSIKPRFYKEFSAILVEYSKSTNIYMNDYEGHGDWKLSKIGQLIQISDDVYKTHSLKIVETAR